jgi:hypothetical protein
VGGYLAAGAVQLQALRDARTSAAMHAALVTTATRWAFIAAAVTTAVALATAPARRRVARPIVGKLDGSGESSASGGGLAHTREDHFPGTR